MVEMGLGLTCAIYFDVPKFRPAFICHLMSKSVQSCEESQLNLDIDLSGSRVVSRRGSELFVSK